MFSKPKEVLNNDTEYLVSVNIGLTNDYQIDLSIILYDENELAKRNPHEFAQKSAEFLNIVNRGKLKKQILELLIHQISNKENESLVDNIVGYWTLVDQQEKKTKKKNFIKPSEVFARYNLVK